MFRELSRKNKKISDAECVELLINEKRGVLSVNGENGYPYGMPMNHYYNEEDGCIYFHCAKNGYRIDSLNACNKVSFCVVEKGEASKGDWGLIVRSVIVFGKIDIIEDTSTVAYITDKLSRKFTNDEEYIKKEITSFVHMTALLRLTPENICGKKVKES